MNWGSMVVLLLAGCVAQTGMPDGQSYPAELLDGTPVFGEVIEPAPGSYVTAKPKT